LDVFHIIKGIKHGLKMKIKYCSNYDQMSNLAYNSILTELKVSSNQLICAATGNSPTGIYKLLSDINNEHPEYFKETNIIKLDEWGGLNIEDTESCEFYVRNKILQPLHISDNRYISFKSDAPFPEEDCKRVQSELDAKGPIDICILGLGKNGHIGFNEPADFLTRACHIGELTETSMQHQMTNSMKTKPTYGVTLGMADIFCSKKIILLITGSNKEKIIEQLLTEKITSHLPASFLWMHPNVECYIDKEYLR